MSSPEASPASLFPTQVNGGGAEDNRYLWPQMLRAIDEIRPAWVVGENVAGITTMVEGGIPTDLGGQASLFAEGDELHGYELEQSFTIERVCGDLERIGYSVQPMLIPAAACGAPHRRDRVFIIAYADPDIRRPGTSEEGGRAAGERGGGYVFTAERGCEAQRPDGLSPIQGENQSRRGEGEERLQVRRGASGYDRPLMRGLHPSERWAFFPTVSPIHRGNDGLPFPLDNLTISPGKWRTESLKAYGNAIVPQVMYRIFQAIEEVENQ